MLLGNQFIATVLADTKAQNDRPKHVKGIYSKERDKAIIYRMYYYYKIKGYRYDLIIEWLSKEFFLGETTLAQIIMRERDQLEQLKADNVPLKSLKAEFPHLSWN